MKIYKFQMLILAICVAGAGSLAFGEDRNAPTKVSLWTGGPLPAFIEVDLRAGTIKASQPTSPIDVVRNLMPIQRQALSEVSDQVWKSGASEPIELPTVPKSRPLNHASHTPPPMLIRIPEEDQRCLNIDAVAQFKITKSGKTREFPFSLSCASPPAAHLVQLLRCNSGTYFCSSGQ